MRYVRPIVAALVIAAGTSVGCSSDPGSTTHTGTGGARGGAAGSAAAGHGGSPSSGSGGAATGGAGAPGTGGTVGTGGGTGGGPNDTGGAGGAAAGSGGNAAGHGGTAGSGGGGGATGAGGLGGAGPAAAFDKLRMECPCKTGAGDHLSNNNCNVTPATDRQTVTKKMGGDPGTVYDVTFRVRGLTEPNTYTGGMLHDPDHRLYTGGSTSTAGYTSYMMTVADPAQHYFFNYNPTTDHIHFLLDYMITVKIRGGATVTFDVDGDGSVPDGHQVSNFDQLVVPGVPPAPDWYDGQFVQLDVVSVVAAP